MTDRTPKQPPRIVTVPNGAEMIMAPEMPEGVASPPMATMFNIEHAGDGHGGDWIVWRFSDVTGTFSQSIRMPIEAAPEFAQAILGGTMQFVAQIQAKRGPKLLRPGQVDFEALRNLGRQNGNGHGPGVN